MSVKESAIRTHPQYGTLNEILSYPNMWKPQYKLVKLLFTHIIYGSCCLVYLLYIRYHPAIKFKMLVYSKQVALCDDTLPSCIIDT
jgi:hypothetical protein